MRLTKHTVTSNNACAFTVSFKGHGQLVDHKIARLAAFRQNGTHCLKNLRIVISTNLKRLGPGIANKHTDIEIKGHICACAQSASNNEGQATLSFFFQINNAISHMWYYTDKSGGH
jgi:hypothetical protein